MFFLPVLQDDIGTAALLFTIAGACLVGMLVTIAFRIETRGRSLDELSHPS